MTLIRWTNFEKFRKKALIQCFRQFLEFSHKGCLDQVKNSLKSGLTNEQKIHFDRPIPVAAFVCLEKK